MSIVLYYKDRFDKLLWRKSTSILQHSPINTYGYKISSYGICHQTSQCSPISTTAFVSIGKRQIELKARRKGKLQKYESRATFFSGGQLYGPMASRKPMVLAKETRHGHNINGKQEMMCLFISLQQIQIKTFSVSCRAPQLLVITTV